MRSVIALEMAAPPELVFRLAGDVRRWPDLLPHYVSVQPVSEVGRDGVLVARMVARRPISSLLGLDLPVTWQARVWSEPDALRLRFRHVAGATRGMDVTWRIEPTDRGCHVSIEHRFEPRLALFAIIVDRWFTRPIASRTLAAFKALAEALAESTASPSEHVARPRPESNPPAVANPPT